MFDGFYAVCTNLESEEDIIKIISEKYTKSKIIDYFKNMNLIESIGNSYIPAILELI